MSRTRRFARWVGGNIDGASIKLLPRTDVAFTKDPRLLATTQIGNEFYRGNRLDRGHLARRVDLLWGEMPEAQAANRDSFYYTNIAPQMDDFNQSRQDGLCRGAGLPAEYWKLLFFREHGVLKSRAFLLTQDLEHLRALQDLDEFRVYQIGVTELEERTRLRFPDAVPGTGALPEREPLSTAADIAW